MVSHVVLLIWLPGVDRQLEGRKPKRYPCNRQRRSHLLTKLSLIPVWLLTSPWKSPFTRLCRPIPAAWGSWRETRCGRRPTLAFPWSRLRSCTARDISSSTSTNWGTQTEDVQSWNPADFCTEEPARVTVSVEDRIVTVRAWRYDLEGRSGHIVPIYLLDTDLDGNSGWDQRTDRPPVRRRHRTIACSRKSFWAWAGSAWRMPWACM